MPSQRGVDFSRMRVIQTSAITRIRRRLPAGWAEPLKRKNKPLDSGSQRQSSARDEGLFQMSKFAAGSTNILAGGNGEYS